MPHPFSRRYVLFHSLSRGRVVSLFVCIYLASLTFHRAYQLSDFDPEMTLYVPYQPLLAFPWFVAGFVFFLFRSISRLLVTRLYHWEDGLFYFAAVLSFIVFGLYWAMVTMYDPDTNGVTMTYSATARIAQQYLLGVEIVTAFAAFGFKASLLAHFTRLFTPAPSRKVILPVSAILAVQTLATLILYLVQCMPLSAVWTSNAPGLCMSYVALGWAALLPDAATTVLVLLVPVCYLTRVSWDAWKALCAFLMFAFSAFAIFLVVLQIAAEANLVEYGTQGVSEVAVWMCGNYLILTNLTTLHPLFSKSARRTARCGYDDSESFIVHPKAPIALPLGDEIPLAPIQTSSRKVSDLSSSEIGKGLPSYGVHDDDAKDGERKARKLQDREEIC